MALERIFELMQQDLIDKASQLSQDSSQLLREGKIDEATARVDQVNTELGRAKLVRSIREEILQRLEGAGIKQPPIEIFNSNSVTQLPLVVEAPIASTRTAPIVRQSLPIVRIDIDEEEIPAPSAPLTSLIAPSDDRAPFVPNPAQSSALHTEAASLNNLDTNATSGGSDKRTEGVSDGNATDSVTAGGLISERKSGDLGERQEKIGRALFSLNEDRTDFAYPTLEDAVPDIYEDLLRNVPAVQRNGKISSYRSNSSKTLEALTVNLAAIAMRPDAIKPYMAQFLDWIKAQPEYANLTIDDYIKILERKITFDQLSGSDSSANTGKSSKNEGGSTSREIQGEVDVKLTGVEVYSFAKKLTTVDQEVLVRAGLEIRPDDLNEARVILGKLEANLQIVQQASQSDTEDVLVAKILAYQRDKSKVFMANLDNQDAQFLFALIASLGSDTAVREIFGSPVEPQPK